MSFYIQSYPFRRTARRLAAESQIRPLGVNVREEDNAYVLSALVPGLKAEDLNIQVLENVVSIEGEYKAGRQSMIINHKDVPVQGVLYYRLDSGNYSATKKMIRID